MTADQLLAALRGAAARLYGGEAALSGHPWLADALNLRRCDDDAKVPGKATRTLAEWEPLVHRYFAKRRVTSDT